MEKTKISTYIEINLSIINKKAPETLIIHTKKYFHPDTIRVFSTYFKIVHYVDLLQIKSMVVHKAKKIKLI